MVKVKKIRRRLNIKRRVRKIVNGTAERPRMSVFRSNKQIYVQLIDDLAGKTLLAASSRENGIEEEKITKIEKAAKVGALIAEKAKAECETRIKALFQQIEGGADSFDS